MDHESYEKLELIAKRVARRDQPKLSDGEAARLVRAAIREQIALTDVEDYLDYRDNLA